MLAPHSIRTSKEVLQRGLKVNILRDGKKFYDPVKMGKFREDGNHVFETMKGSVIK